MFNLTHDPIIKLSGVTDFKMDEKTLINIGKIILFLFAVYLVITKIILK